MAGTLRTEPRQARSAQTLDRLLDAAEQLFFTKGVAETSTVDIAKAAGVSVGRLYYWYPDKDAVVVGVMDRAQRLVEEFLTTHLVDDSEEPATVLVRRIIETLSAFGSIHPGVVSVLHLRTSRPDDPGQALFDLIVGHLGALIAGRAPGTSHAEARLVATVIARLAISLLDERLRLAGDEERANLTAEECYLIMAYLAARFPQPHMEIAEFVAPARFATRVDGDYGRFEPVVIAED